MDSYTQVILGAAVGEAVLGHKVGNRAVVWGGVAGLIPDLDIYFPPNQEALQWIVLHRGFSHSILFAILFGLLMGYILSRIYKKQPASWVDWSKLAFWALFTHALLDCLTVFGTQIFLPFSNYRVEIGSIAFKDYIYTVPLLATVLAILFFRKYSRTRRWIIFTGLILTTGYLGYAGINKMIAEKKFRKALSAQNISYDRLRTGPKIYSSSTWYALAETADGFQTAYLSIFDDHDVIRFEYIPKNETLISEFLEARELEKIAWFTNGYFFAEKIGENVVLHDLRFGNPRYGSSGGNFVFSFILEKNNDGDDGLKVRFKDRD